MHLLILSTNDATSLMLACCCCMMLLFSNENGRVYGLESEVLEFSNQFRATCRPVWVLWQIEPRTLEKARSLEWNSSSPSKRGAKRTAKKYLQYCTCTVSKRKAANWHPDPLHSHWPLKPNCTHMMVPVEQCSWGTSVTTRSICCAFGIFVIIKINI